DHRSNRPGSCELPDWPGLCCSRRGTDGGNDRVDHETIGQSLWVGGRSKKSLSIQPPGTGEPHSPGSESGSALFFCVWSRYPGSEKLLVRSRTGGDVGRLG